MGILSVGRGIGRNLARDDLGSGQQSRQPSSAMVVLSIAAGLVLVAAGLTAWIGPSAVALDDAQQVMATLVPMLTLVIAARAAPGPQRRIQLGLAIAMSFAALGMILWDLEPSGSATAAGPAVWLFLVAIVALGATIVPPVFSGFDRLRLAAVALDAAILVVAAATLLGAVWLNLLPNRDDATATALVGALVLMAGPAAIVLALLHRAVRPHLWGSYAVVGGLVLIGTTWVAWLTMLVSDAPPSVAPADFAYSAGMLLVAYGGLTWDLSPASQSSRLYQAAVRVFPLAATALCVALDLLTPRSGVSLVEIGAAGVVALTLMRQVLLTLEEHRARLAEEEASARLANELKERVAVLRVLARVEPGPTPHETAQRICVEALGLDGIESAVVRAFVEDGPAVVLGVAGAGDAMGLRGMPMSLERTAQLWENATRGPWVERFSPAIDPHLSSLYEAGLRTTVNAPLLWNDQTVGVVGLSTTFEGPGFDFGERLTTVLEFGMVAGALLGPALADLARAGRLRRAIGLMIEDEAFTPVFQPVIEIATGITVGFEALTRFADGLRPDFRFAEAAAAGQGIPLELACLRASIREARALPESAWLSLNVSPDLAEAVTPLIAILETAERDVVLEITEHAAIGSYANLKAALSEIPSHVRIAVDDAGAGYAGLQHILEIQPDIVKLDIALVRSVDADPARRALISSMVTFARETGSTLLAEGVETEAELATLRSLGVILAQGYLLGRPEPIGSICRQAA